MDSNFIDIIILIFILAYGLLGFKRGFFKQSIIFIGTILVILISYKFKNVIGDFLALNLPFFKFENILNGAVSLNIIFYQAIGFLLVSVVLTVIFKIIVAITGIFEKILRFTIVLGFPSKILGLLVGLIEGYILTFAVLFVLYQPIFNLKILNESKYASVILNKSPFLSKMAKNTLDTVEEIYNLTDINDANTLNLKVVDIILDKEVATVELVDKLVDKGKLNISNIDSVIDKYR